MSFAGILWTLAKVPAQPSPVRRGPDGRSPVPTGTERP